MNVKCPKCGAVPYAGAKFCTSCGASLTMQSFESQSTFIGLLAAGKPIFRPWGISIDGIERRVTVKNLNKYMTGLDEKVVSISQLREVKIEDLFVASNIFIKTFGTGTIGCYGIPRKDARKIRDILFP